MILKYAKLLEGLPRHTGMHAAGVVIGEKPLIEIIPLTREPKENLTVVQFDKDASEAIGLLKWILGLKNLTVIYETCDLIKRNHKINIDPEKLFLQIKRFLIFLAKGDTIEFFQCESPYDENLKASCSRLHTRCDRCNCIISTSQ